MLFPSCNSLLPLPDKLSDKHSNLELRQQCELVRQDMLPELYSPSSIDKPTFCRLFPPPEKLIFLLFF